VTPVVTAHPDIAGLSDWHPLARGGFAAVWQARQDSLGRQVAVKVDFRPLDDDKQRRRFLREAGAAGRLSGHPGIVTVHDAGILPDDRPYLVLELCPGGSLSAWLSPEKRPPIQRVRDVGVRIADALAAAHARGVIHRDVKPANILIDAYGHAGLTDFGLAAMPEPGAELSVTMEALTPAYAPPEMFHSHPATESGDVYSLAATLYALLAGHPPRWPTDGHTPTLPELIELHASPPADLPQVPSDLMDVLAAGLAAEGSERPTAAQFRDRLAAVDLGPDATVDRRAMALTGGGTGTSGVIVASPSTDPSREVGESLEPPSGRSGDHSDGQAQPAEKLAQETTGDRQRRDRTLFLAVLVLVVALLAAGIVYVSLTGRQADPIAVPSPGGAGTGTQSASPTPTSASPSPSEDSPTPELVDGFLDCGELGYDAVCPEEPECWGSLQNFGDVPVVATPIDCTDPHPFQTFVAVQLDSQPRTQSALEKTPAIQALCTKQVLNQRLSTGRTGAQWQIQAIPYKVFPTADNLSRCLVSTGVERKAPLPMKAP
jgi:serine/threonine protein kinase